MRLAVRLLTYKSKMAGTTRKLIDQFSRVTVLQIIGIVLLCFGIFIFVLFTILSLFGVDLKSQGTAAAIAFMVILIGVCFLFPDMLKGGVNETVSTMRVSVFSVTCVFIFFCIKYGWDKGDFASIGINAYWTSIIIAALGGKAVQSFAENNAINKLNTPINSSSQLEIKKQYLSQILSNTSRHQLTDTDKSNIVNINSKIESIKQ